MTARRHTRNRTSVRTDRTSFGVERLDDRLAPAVFTATINPAVDNNAATAEVVDFFLRASVNGESDTINLFPNGTYTFASASNAIDGKNVFATIGPDGIGKHTVTVNGRGATFDRNSADNFRYFRVVGSPATVQFKLNDLTLRNGATQNFDDGGAILMKGAEFVVTNVRFENNTAGGRGGAISVQTTTASDLSTTYNNVVFSKNTSRTGGGAIDYLGVVGYHTFNNTRFLNNTSANETGAITGFGGNWEFNDSTISGNTGGSGGALDLGPSVVTLQGTTVSGNSSKTSGTGGIQTSTGGSGGSVKVVNSYIGMNSTQSTSTFSVGGAISGKLIEIINSTIDSNSAPAAGGVNASTLKLTHATIVGNQSTSTTPSVGGVRVATSFVATHSIIANNKNGDNSKQDNIDLDVPTGTTSGNFNLIGTTPPNFLKAGGDIAGTKDTPEDSKLGPAQMNGGVTFTRAPAADSKAVNNGDVVAITKGDQRGATRVVGGKADIGAFEVQNGNTVGVDSGTYQTAPVNAGYNAPLVAIVTGPNGQLIPNAQVQFDAPTVPNPTASANLNNLPGVRSAGVTTGLNGKAQILITANDTAGAFVVRASLQGSPLTADFKLINTNFNPPPPSTAKLTIVSGDGKEAAAGAVFVDTLKVQVLDNGQPVTNVPITFNSPVTGSTVTFTGGVNTITQPTDLNGFVNLPVTAGTLAGPVVVTAQAAGLGGVAFNLNVIANLPSVVKALSGDAQSALTLTSFTNPLRIEVSDKFGNLVPAGVNVTFTSPPLTSGPSAKVGGATNTIIVQTDDAGRAQTNVVANDSGGTFAVVARVANGTQNANFTLTNIQVPPPPPPPPPLPANRAPFLSELADTKVAVGSSLSLPLTVIDFETAADSLTLEVVAEDTKLVSGLGITGTGSNRTVTVTTAAGQSGATTITVRATDALESGSSGKALTTTETFVLTVQNDNNNGNNGGDPTLPPVVNTPPSITDIPNQSFLNNVTKTVPFLVNDAETKADLLNVTASAADRSLFSSLTITGTGTNRNVVMVPAENRTGTTTVTVTVTDTAGGTTKDTFDVALGSSLPPPPPPQQRQLVGFPQLAVGGGTNAPAVVRSYNADGSERFVAPGLAGSTRTATGDFNRDGVGDVVVGSGPGGVSDVRVLNGTNGEELFRIQPFENAFTGGVYVAAGDLNGDGVSELIITPDQGGGPRVRVFNGAANFSQLDDFFGINDTAFRGGARAATGDVNGDGVADLVVSAGFGGGPRIAGFSGRTIGGLRERIFRDFFFFENTLRNGAFVTVGDIDGDGFAEVIAGGGPGGGPRVRALAGKSLLEDIYVTRANFFAGNDADRGGVRVAVKDLDGDRLADLIVGSGEGSGSRVIGYTGATISPTGTPPIALDLDAFPGFSGGVFVG